MPLDEKQFIYPLWGGKAGMRQHRETKAWEWTTPEEERTLSIRMQAAQTDYLRKIRGWMITYFVLAFVLPVGVLILLSGALT